MAKYERHRGMYFGSWTGQDIAEYAGVDIGDSTGVTKCEVDAATFGTSVNKLPGEYTFVYTGEQWELNGVAVQGENLSTTYGLTVTGEPKKGDLLVVTYNPKSSGWEALGKDNDELTKELNPDTETSKNVLGEATMVHNGYEPEISADPYYVDPSRKMYKRLLDIAMQELYGEGNCLGYFAEAFFTAANPETRKMTGYCYVRQAWFIPQSTGGDTAGFAIPVNINPVGAIAKKKIVYDMATNEATITDFTEATE